jgi:hypothetical protein
MMTGKSLLLRLSKWILAIALIGSLLLLLGHSVVQADDVSNQAPNRPENG